MANDILRYTSRDFESIKADLIDAIPGLTSLWTSREDGDPGIVLIKLMSALGDMLSFNFDKQALEYYAPTVTQRKNASKLFSLIGYSMHWYKGAKTTVNITYTPPMPSYLYFCKRIVDGEDAVNVYYDYRCDYLHNANDIDGSNGSLSLPPITSSDGTMEPSPDGWSRATITDNILSEYQDQSDPSIIDSIPSTEIKSNQNFISHANSFASLALQLFDVWQNNNIFELHTFINDQNKTLELYSSTYTEPIYSIIPTTQETSGIIPIKAFSTVSVSAIQGNLCSTNFQTRNLKDNRFYLPDSNVDQDYIFLSYNTDDVSVPAKFITKTDNLLTETGSDDNKRDDLYFQFGVDEYDYPYIELSSYWKEMLGENSVRFTVYYFRTLGKAGNITTDYLKSLNSFRSQYLDIHNVENSIYVTGSNGDIISEPGQDPETAREAYINSINYIMTYDTVVTIYDFMRFARRQEGISNAFACDGQYANDLNKELDKLCNSYSKDQLIDILGTSVSGLSEEDLRKCLYNIRKINYDFKTNAVTISDAETQSKDSSIFINYRINIYPVVGDYRLQDIGEDAFAKEDNGYEATGKIYPYQLYRINTDDDPTVTNFKIQTQLDKAYREVRVANVEPAYTAVRVFDWRLCGTVHLTKTVTNEEAQGIINTIISTVKEVYSVYNVQFGKKIDYMQLIDIIVSCDDRIRYFDAGRGDKKLVVFKNYVGEDATNYFPPEAYFNNESLMRYDKDDNGEYVMVDPSYIQQEG